MQLHIRTGLIATLSLVIFLTSCSKSNKQGKMIPKNAGFVMHMNAGSINGKINMEELKQTDWYKQILAEMRSDTTAPDFVKRMQQNTQSSGIDSLADFIFFGENNIAEGMKLVLEGGIKDAKAFESFVKYIYPEGNISKEGDISVMPIKDKGLLSWNAEKFALGIQAPSVGGPYSMGRDYGTDHAKDSSTSSQLAVYCKKLYTLKDEDNLSKDEKFTTLMNTEGDMHFWINTEKLMSGSMQMGMLSMMKMDKFLEGNISTITLNFENGKITVKSKGYAGKEMSDLYSKYSGGKINTDMIKNIPSQDIVGVFAFHFKPEGLKELVKLTGMDGFADLMLMRQGFTVDDFIKANKGDIMIAVTDLAMKTDSFSYKGFDGKMQSSISSSPDAKFIFAASIDDKDAFNKLIRAGKEAAGGAGDGKLTYNSNNNYFAISNTPDLITKYLAGSNKTDAPFLSKISGNAMGAYVDLQKIMKAFESEASKDSTGRLAWQESVKMWQDLTFTGGDYSGGGYNQTLEVNLVDKNTNSLRQLFRYGMTMANFAKEKQKKLEAEFNLSDAGNQPKIHGDTDYVRQIPPAPKKK